MGGAIEWHDNHMSDHLRDARLKTERLALVYSFIIPIVGFIFSYLSYGITIFPYMIFLIVWGIVLSITIYGSKRFWNRVPERVGISSEGIHLLFPNRAKCFIDWNSIGAVTLIHNKYKVYCINYNFIDLKQTKPVSRHRPYIVSHSIAHRIIKRSRKT